MTRDEGALLAGAKAFLAGETGVIETARALCGRRDVRPELKDDVTTFVAVESETDAFPVGEARALWNPGALAKLDPEIAAAAEHYRKYVHEACEHIVSVLSAQA